MCFSSFFFNFSNFWKIFNLFFYYLYVIFLFNLIKKTVHRVSNNEFPQCEFFYSMRITLCSTYSITAIICDLVLNTITLRSKMVLIYIYAFSILIFFCKFYISMLPFSVLMKPFEKWYIYVTGRGTLLWKRSDQDARTWAVFDVERRQVRKVEKWQFRRKWIVSLVLAISTPFYR